MSGAPLDLDLIRADARRRSSDTLLRFEQAAVSRPHS